MLWVDRLSCPFSFVLGCGLGRVLLGVRSCSQFKLDPFVRWSGPSFLGCLFVGLFLGLFSVGNAVFSPAALRFISVFPFSRGVARF